MNRKVSARNRGEANLVAISSKICTKILSLNRNQSQHLLELPKDFFLCLCPHAMKPTSTTLKSKVWGHCRLKRKTISFGGTSTSHLFWRIWATSWHHADDVKPSFHHESQWVYTLQNLLIWAKLWECPCGCSWKVPGKQRIHISFISYLNSQFQTLMHLCDGQDLQEVFRSCQPS